MSKNNTKPGAWVEWREPEDAAEVAARLRMMAAACRAYEDAVADMGRQIIRALVPLQPAADHIRSGK